MNRITEFEIAGKKYPLNFSVKAARVVDERFGGLDNVKGIFGWGNIAESLYNISFMLSLLMEQGAAYKEIVEGEKITLPTADELDTLIGAPDVVRAQTAIFEAVGISMKTTVEVEPDAKNAEATQGE